jgi:Zn ribbon nucleic-acid-binding protein
MNEQLSKEEYQQRIKGIDLGSYKNYSEWKKKITEHWKNYQPKPVYDDFSEGCTGTYCFQSKNCKECYEVQGAEDSKYLMLIKNGKVKDACDYTDWGFNADRIYECMTVGQDVTDVRFSHEAGFNLLDVEYSKLSTSGSHHFGCVSIDKTNYCILNKQYSKEEYEKLRKQIIEDMNMNPYISREGHVYKYGEFFPPEFSPHAYNDTFASRFFPITKEAVIAKGLSWYEPEEREYAITIASKDLPDHIKDAPDTITKEVIGCATCKRGFRVIPQELQFLCQHNLPLPRRCPFCRIWEKVDRWVENMTLHDRICDKCGAEFQTHYTKERAPKIFCKKCYQAEFL